MLQAFVAWVLLWCVLFFLLTKLSVMKRADARHWRPHLLRGLVALVLASLALAVFVNVF